MTQEISKTSDLILIVVVSLLKPRKINWAITRGIRGPDNHSSSTMYTTVSSWVETRHESIEKWTKAPVEKQEDHLVIAALESLLNHEASGSVTAKKIKDIYLNSLVFGHRTSVSFVWGVFADASRWFGASHTQQLVDLIVAIKQLPDVVNKAGYVVTHGGRVIFRELHDFGWIFFEHGLDLDLQTEGSTYAEWHVQAPGHLNSHTFAATWMQREKASSLFYADRAFDNILQPFDETREMADEWKMYIPPAAVWITISGEVLYDLCFKERTVEESQVARRVSPQIWSQAKQRFAALAEQMDIDDHCRGLAREAAEEMERIEQQA
ncbi:hypothetical protein KCU78_g2556, partial [Aureobasidium melanogenum]